MKLDILVEEPDTNFILYHNTFVIDSLDNDLSDEQGIWYIAQLIREQMDIPTRMTWGNIDFLMSLLKRLKKNMSVRAGWFSIIKR